MAAGMTDLPASDQPEIPNSLMVPATPSVVVVVTTVPGVDPSATLAAVARQDGAGSSVVLVTRGAEPAPGIGDVETADTVEDVVAGLGPETDYIWILHGDAEPRPDALAALIHEAERHEASLVGSKLLVAGTRDTLEGIGSATDVFGEPYTGLDEGEVDLEQYDVVRDVAFVSSVSMLVRRDLMRGLRALDRTLPPTAAGLDLSQRVRIAGGRVMVAPSSEVFHHRRCGRGDGGWREQAGRMRAMLKAYSPITLVWMIPFAVLVGILDLAGSLLLGRWRLIPRYLLTWGWNAVRLPSTITSRRGLARVRHVGDEELFRYQVRGSVRLRAVGSELADRLIGLFDDDRPMARRATEVWNSAGTWGAAGAVVAVVIGVRAVFLGALPVVGHSLPLADSAATTLGRFFGGWNSAGLGSASAIHPAAGLGAFVQAVTLGNPVLAKAAITLVAFVIGVFGMGRLASRLKVGGPGSYLGGVVAMFGPVTALLAADARWSALVAVGVLPWALASVIGPVATTMSGRIGALGRAVFLTGVVAALAPLLGLAPLVFAIAVRLVGRFRGHPLRALAGTAAGAIGVPYLLTHPSLLLEGVSLRVEVGVVALMAMTVAVLAGMVSGTWRVSALAGTMTFGGLLLARVVGPEVQVAALSVAAVGSGLAVAAALRRHDGRQPVGWLALAGGLAVVALAMPALVGGRAGLPPDAWGSNLAFVGLEPGGVERALLVAPDPVRLPGESRPGPGFWYRLVDVEGPTLDQAVLAAPGPGDLALREALDTVMSGAALEPGGVLAEFGIRWVVAVDETISALRTVLDGQVDLEVLPLGETILVYANTAARSVAVDEMSRNWDRLGSGFAGPVDDTRVRLAIQGDDRWGPDWQDEQWWGTISAESGVARFGGDLAVRAGLVTVVVFMLAAAVVGVWWREPNR
ncbi:hypothetical protein BH23ACT5_BH23ACT5_14020 [soil metagenome]